MKRRNTRVLLAAALVGLVTTLLVATGATARSSDVPSVTAIPTIEGPADNPFVGDTLTASTGTWTGSPTKFAYQWDRCNATGDRQGCNAIAGGTSKAYKVQSGDVDHTLRVRVTATNASGSTTKDSKGTGVVSAAAAPKAQSRPTIEGSMTVGSTLTAKPGTWSGATSLAYEWQQCDAGGNACTTIDGATGKTYGVRSGDAGHTLRVKVTATNKYGSTASTSDRTEAVTAAPAGTTTPTSNTCTGGKTTADATALQPPERMLIDRFSFSPRVITRSTRSFTARIHVGTASGNCSVAGAKLWSTAIPYNQTDVVQGVTGADGWATMTFTMKGGFPANPGRQQILAMLVRATRPGGSVLAGVSTRRTLAQRVALR